MVARQNAQQAMKHHPQSLESPLCTCTCTGIWHGTWNLESTAEQEPYLHDAELKMQLSSSCTRTMLSWHFTGCI